MELDAVITIANNNEEMSTFHLTDSVDFVVTITDPCIDPVLNSINDIVFDPATVTVDDGETASTSWSPPRSTVDDTHNDDELCGRLSY